MNCKKGFTLFEVLVVIAIIAAVLAIGMPRFGRNQNNVKQIVRELSVLGKEVRHYARLKNATYRIAFRLGEGQDAYWVEASNQTILIQSEEKQKKQKELSDKEQPRSPFSKVNKPLKEEKKLPSNLSFAQVELKGRDPVRKGMAYIHFSPEGFVEPSAVQITDGKQMTWTLIFNPLTGHADIMEKPVSLKDVEKE